MTIILKIKPPLMSSNGPINVTVVKNTITLIVSVFHFILTASVSLQVSQFKRSLYSLFFFSLLKNCNWSRNCCN